MKQKYLTILLVIIIGIITTFNFLIKAETKDSDSDLSVAACEAGKYYCACNSKCVSNTEFKGANAVGCDDYCKKTSGDTAKKTLPAKLKNNGESCKGNNECQSNLCSNSICKAKDVKAIDKPAPVVVKPETPKVAPVIKQEPVNTKIAKCKKDTTKCGTDGKLQRCKDENIGYVRTNEDCGVKNILKTLGSECSKNEDCESKICGKVSGASGSRCIQKDTKVAIAPTDDKTSGKSDEKVNANDYFEDGHTCKLNQECLHKNCALDTSTGKKICIGQDSSQLVGWGIGNRITATNPAAVCEQYRTKFKSCDPNKTEGRTFTRPGSNDTYTCTCKQKNLETLIPGCGQVYQEVCSKTTQRADGGNSCGAGRVVMDTVSCVAPDFQKIVTIADTGKSCCRAITDNTRLSVTNPTTNSNAANTQNPEVLRTEILTDINNQWADNATGSNDLLNGMTICKDAGAFDEEVALTYEALSLCVGGVSAPSNCTTVTQSINATNALLYGDKQHRGTDVACGSTNDNILSPINGEVVALGPDVFDDYSEGLGRNTLVIQSNRIIGYAADGEPLYLYVISGHSDSVNVEFGETVRSGDPIASIGNEGNSTAEHLHVECAIATEEFVIGSNNSRPEGALCEEGGTVECEAARCCDGAGNNPNFCARPNPNDPQNSVCEGVVPNYQTSFNPREVNFDESQGTFIDCEPFIPNGNATAL